MVINNFEIGNNDELVLFVDHSQILATSVSQFLPVGNVANEAHRFSFLAVF